MSSFRRMSWVMPAFVLLLGGCESEVERVPAGPGVAEKADLKPYLAGAKEISCTGFLRNINVHSQKGSYLTWAMTPAGDHQGAELDVRACRDTAEELQGTRVMVRGKILERCGDHMPLIIVQQMSPEKPKASPPIKDRIPYARAHADDDLGF